jgi:hypothetical protein
MAKSRTGKNDCRCKRKEFTIVKKKFKGVGVFDVEKASVPTAMIEVSLPDVELISSIKALVEQWDGWYQKEYPEKDGLVTHSEYRLLFTESDVCNSNVEGRYYLWQEKPGDDECYNFAEYEDAKDLNFTDAEREELRQIIMEKIKETIFSGKEG